MSSRLRSESGQVLPFVGVVLAAALLGMCALAIDIGLWYKASRHAQSAADAAAIAAVEDLPANPSAALVDADAYAKANGGVLDGNPVITSSSSLTGSDTVTVSVKETAPAIFARILGMTSVTVHGHATAQASGPCFVKGSGISSDGTGRPLPLVVSANDVRATPLGQPTALVYGPADPVAGGQFGLIDFANSNGGTSPGTVGDWIANNFPGNVRCTSYQGITGNKFNSPQVNDPLSAAAATGTVIVLPVYTSTNGASGGQMQYNIGGFASFKPTSFTADGSTSVLYGAFVHLDIPQQGQPGPYFGAGRVKLTK